MGIVVSENCVGCGVCKEICPKHAIVMQGDEKGFLYPQINRKLCVECGLCEKYCNAHNQVQKYERGKFKALKLKDEALRIKSSSGGAYIALAQYFIAHKAAVYGCEWNKQLQAVHNRAETAEGCMKFMGSKYVQSDMQNILPMIEEDLINQKPVLFTGTSCQCAAVRRMLELKEVDCSGLLLCEILCHGVTAPLYFNDFKKMMEEKYRGKIVWFLFRDKEKVKNPPSSRGMRMGMRTKRGMLDIYDEKENNKYYTMFKYDYVLRDCCYNCNYVGVKRVADISIADYWGCDYWHPEFFDKKGISLMLINSVNGENIYHKIEGKCESIDIMPKEAMQKPLKLGAAKQDDYNAFWSTYMKRGYKVAVSLYSKKYIRQEYKYRVKQSLKNRIPAGLYKIINKT